MSERFSRFCKNLEAEVANLAGDTWRSRYDLADAPYQDYFEDGYSPKEAAEHALEDAGFTGERVDSSDD
tara:strand:+ start:2157 stop:2363 length:207 start_codon:yes stop_codon:yes gene_type:complete